MTVRAELILLAAMLPALASAQVPAAPDELPPLELGDIPRFASEAAARAHCVADAVVWADSSSGYFYGRAHPKYGHGEGGAFTCLADAKRADYWNIDPFAGNPERGREFPIDPSLLEYGS